MAPRYTVVMTSSRYRWDMAPEQAILQRFPELAVDLQSAAVNSEEDLIAVGREADALLCSTLEACNRHVISNLARTKVIARYGVGLDNVDLDAATDHGIVVTHFPQYCTNEVADHAFALILALNRRIVEFDRALKNGAWVALRHETRKILRGPIPPLREQTLGIVGFGRIGQAVGRRAVPFGLTILAADPYVDAEVAHFAGVDPVSLEELLTRSDIVSIHCPLTPETRSLIGAEQLALMKPTAILVNTARGPIVDVDAAAEALAAGRLAGAGLDVVTPEPLPADHPLYTLPNVILTPHAAYYSERSVEVVREQTLLEALAVLQGRRPQTVANPAVLEKVHLT
jgi:D-3-phosphoglycerate dehydrogenase / 2-oxoglutarate reductase